MNKNLQIVLFILIVLLFGAFIFYSSWRSKSPPALTGEEMQALIDSTTAPANATPLSEKELKKLIDSTTAPSKSTPLSEKELEKLIDSTTAPKP